MDRLDRPGGSPMTRGWSRLSWLLAGLLVLAGAALHFWYWYGPRFHALPVEESRLLPPPSEVETSIWLPYPHQNWKALERELVDPEELVAAAGRLLGREGLRLPRLEPFGIPPSREASLRVFPRGGRSIQLAVYPLVRWSSRIAGELAGNPWLRGGAVRYDGDPASVTWSSGVWRVESSSTPPPGAPGAGEVPAGSEARVWARLSSDRALGPLPAGRYDLTMEGAWARLTPVGREASVPRLPEGVVLAVAERRESDLRLFVLAEGSPLGVAGIRLPGFLTVARDRGEAAAWFPGHDLLRELDAVHTRPRADGSLAVASDETLFPLASAIVESWERWMVRERVGIAARVRRGEAALLARGVAELLEEIPLASEAEHRRWRDGATVLSSLESLDGILVWGPEGG
ncbi:MAG: hypothetical protein R3234_06860 [Thermoanaerobaculia bacterium]|nr:hypothetical protein [Thermoanaerobaculia bacterium]